MADILIVDDDEAIVQVLCELFALEGYAAVGAAHGRAALNWLMTAPQLPRALLVDITMPEMDGPALIAQMAAMPALRDLPVLVMSAERRPGDYLRDLPIAGFLAKPFHLDTLLAYVNRVITPATAKAA
jgi:CheY-like chemotaxis protein